MMLQWDEVHQEMLVDTRIVHLYRRVRKRIRIRKSNFKIRGVTYDNPDL